MAKRAELTRKTFLVGNLKQTQTIRRRQLLFDHLEERVPLASDLQLVKDINTNEQTSLARNFTTIASTLYFSAADFAHGQELWKSDGTTAGTVLVKDIFPGQSDSVSALPSFVNVNGTLFFHANDGTTGFELWKSDGTEAGTQLVRDITVGSGSSLPQNLTNVNGVLYFSRQNGSTGWELWKSDGSANGTSMVKVVGPASAASPAQFFNVNGILYFESNDGSTGRELWKSDGTSSGTVQVKDIQTGIGSSNIGSMTQFGGSLFFTANDGVNGYEVWKSDGTPTGTVRITDVVGSYAVASSLINVSGTLYFRNQTSSERTLWKSDGTTSGTSLIRSFPGTASTNVSSFATINGELYFRANDGTSGDELWKSNGTLATTVRIKDIRTGSGSSSPDQITNVNGTAYFRANDGSGSVLWKTNGTDVGTIKVANVAVNYLTNLAGSLLFRGSPTSGVGAELWKSDGTTNGTALIKDIYAGTGSANVQFVTNANGNAIFQANNSLWNSDGTAVGTFQPTFTGFAPKYFTTINGTTYFSARDSASGYELWKLVGTTASQVKDIRTGAQGSYPQSLVNVNGVLYFSATNGTSGYELWKSDGTLNGTVLVREIRTGTYGSYPRSLTEFNGKLYFAAEDATRGIELWQSDGTTNGTVLLKDIDVGALGSGPSSFKNINGKLYFSASTSATGPELWQSDGTPLGTTMVTEIVQGFTGGSPNNLTNVNGTIYFTATDATSGIELWKSNGTSSGTTRVLDINPGAANSQPNSLTEFKGSLYFLANNGSSGRELWRSDGTPGGTLQVIDIQSGPAGSTTSGLVNLNGTLYFAANDGVRGNELWSSDGTSAGTTLFKDLVPGTLGSNPTSLTGVGSKLFLAATTEATSIELFMLNQNSPPTDLLLSDSSLAENGSPNTVVGTLSGVDSDPGETLSYSLVSGAGDSGNGSFSINGNLLRATSSFNFESQSSYSVRVRVTDSATNTLEKVFVIQVSDVNESPIGLGINSNSVAETASFGTSIGDFSTVDPDTGNSFSYSLVPGVGDANNGSFLISGKTLKSSQAFNYETKNSYSIRVRSTDQGGLFTEAVLTINVTDVLETISGKNWSDLNANGVLDTGEPGLAGWTVYVDTNNNGQLDVSEPSTLTVSDNPATPVDETGNYVLSLPGGTYILRRVLQTGFAPTAPGPIAGLLPQSLTESTYVVALAGISLPEKNFGNSLKRVVQFSSSAVSFNESLAAENSTTTVKVFGSVDSAFGSQISIPVTITVGATAKTGSDFTIANSNMVFAAGSTQGQLEIQLKNDRTYENDESFSLTFDANGLASIGTTSSTTVTIVSNDALPTVQFKLPGTQTTEGTTDKTIDVELILSAPSAFPITVPLTFSQSPAPTPGAPDYVVNGSTTITIPGDQDIESVAKSIIIKADNLVEPLEIVTTGLGTVVGATKATGSSARLTHNIRIAANGTPDVFFAKLSEDKSEGSAKFDVTVTVSPTPTVSVLVPFTVLSSSTAKKDDYKIKVGPDTIDSSGTLTFLAGVSTQTISIEITDDELIEYRTADKSSVETLLLSLGTITGGKLKSGSGTYQLNILDNDIAKVGFAKLAKSPVYESEKTVTFNVESSLKWPQEMQVKVNLSSNNTTKGANDANAYARQGKDKDFVLNSQTIVIPKNTLSASGTITLYDDSLNEAIENIELTLSELTGDGLLDTGNKVLTIGVGDNDPVINIRPATVVTNNVTKEIKSIAEKSQTILFPVKLDDGSSTNATNVDVVVEIIPGTGSLTAKLDTDYSIVANYTPTQGGVKKETSGRYFLYIPKGLVSKSIQVQVNSDLLDEPDEAITLGLANPKGAKLGSVSSSVTINDDDNSKTRVYLTTNAIKHADGRIHVAENDQRTIAVSFELTSPTGWDLLIVPAVETIQQTSPGALVFGSATEGIDFKISNLVNIPAGQTTGSFLITFNDNLLVDGNRGFQIRINRPANTELASFSQSLDFVILDNEINACDTGPVAAADIDDWYMQTELTAVSCKVVSLNTLVDVSASDQRYVAQAGTRGVKTSTGFLIGSSVFFDANRNGVQDWLDDADGIQQSTEPSEPNATTAADGSFRLYLDPAFDSDQSGFIEANEGRWVTFGGVDTSIDLPLPTRLYGNVSEYVVTPLTSLSAMLVQYSGYTIQDAQARVISAMSLPAIADFGSYDALSGLRLGDPTSAAYWDANIELYNVVVGISNLVAGRSGTTSVVDAADQVWRAIADWIAAPESTLSVIAANQVEAIVLQCAAGLGLDVSASEAKATATIIANGNQAMRAIEFSSFANPTHYARALAQVKKVMQGSMASSLFNVGARTTAIDAVQADYTGASLASKIASATVGAIFPSMVGIGDAQISEGQSGTKIMTFTVVRGGDSSAPISVDYTTQNASALAGSDFIAQTGTLTWPAGDDNPRTIDIVINSDSQFESDEQLQVVVTTTNPLIVVKRTLGSGTILNDDGVSFTIAPTSDVEGSEFTIRHESEQTQFLDNGVRAASGNYREPLLASIQGQSNQSDTLLLNFTAETYRPDSLSFDGGTGDGVDTLQTQYGTFESINVKYLAFASTALSLLPLNAISPLTITTTQTDASRLNSTIKKLAIELPLVGTGWILEDADPLQPGTMRLRNIDPTYQSIEFTNPTDALLISGSGAAELTVASLDPEFKDLAGNPLAPSIIAGTAPSGLTLSQTSIGENSAANSIVGSLAVANPNASGAITYSLVDGTGGEHNANFTIDGSGNLRTQGVFDFETQRAYNILVRATNSSQLSIDRAFTIDILDVNESATSLNISQAFVAENMATGATVGRFTNDDPDLTETTTFQLLNGTNDNAYFTLDGDVLKTTQGFNFELDDSYSIEVRATDSAGHIIDRTLVISVTNVVEDVTRPLSAVQPLTTNATSLVIPITIAATDPAGPELDITGIREFELYAAIDSGAYSLVTVLPASTTTYSYVATSNHNYYFRTLARDFAGNLEVNTGGADAFTWVRDFDKPDTSVISANFDSQGLFTINVSGRDLGGAQLTRFDVYAAVDLQVSTLIGSINAGSPNTAGMHAGTLNYQGLTDGALHNYRFYSRGLDALANFEDAPSSGDVVKSASFEIPASLQATGIDVQLGAKQRSFVQVVDVMFNSATNLSELLATGRVQVEKFGLTATLVAAGTGQAVSATLTQPGGGNRLRLDFGAQGLGGNRNGLAGDGFYRVRVDSNRNGDFNDAGEAFEFHRMLGDANGDGVINDLDTAVVDSFYGRLGTNLDGDLNGDGVVNLIDKSYTLRTYRNRTLATPLRALLDD